MIVMAIMGLVLRAEGDLDGARSMLEAAVRNGRRTGDSKGIAGAALYMACLAGDAGDWDRAATLHGAAQALQDRMSIPWEEFDTRRRRDSLDQARAHLGASSWSAPTPRAWHSASRRPSTWLSEDRVRPDRCRRLTPGRS